MTLDLGLAEMALVTIRKIFPPNVDSINTLNALIIWWNGIYLFRTKCQPNIAHTTTQVARSTSNKLKFGKLLLACWFLIHWLFCKMAVQSLYHEWWITFYHENGWHSDKVFISERFRPTEFDCTHFTDVVFDHLHIFRVN